jgi:hypothetical protein
MMDDQQLAQTVRDTVSTLNDLLKESVGRGIQVRINQEVQQKPGVTPTTTVEVILTKTERLL